MSSDICEVKLTAKQKFILLIDELDSLILSLLDGAPLTEERIYQLCDECLQTKMPQPLVRALGEAFTQPAILARCFQSKVVPDSSNEASKTGKFNSLLILYFCTFFCFLCSMFASLLNVHQNV